MEKLINKIFDINIIKYIYIIISLLYTFPYTSQVTSKYIKFLIILGILLSIKLIINRSIKINKYFIIILIINILSIIGVIINYRNNFNMNAINSFYLFFQTFVMFIYSNKKNDKLINDLYFKTNILVLITFLLSLISLIMVINNTFILINMNKIDLIITGIYEGRLWGVYGNPNTLANISGISIYLSLISMQISHDTTYINNKKMVLIFNSVNIILQFFCIVFTSSRSTLIAIMVSLFFILAFWIFTSRFKKINKIKIIIYGSILTILILLSSIIYVFYGASFLGRKLKSPDITNGRTAIWNSSINVIEQNLIFGVGTANVEKMVYPYLKSLDKTAVSGLASNMHNIFLQLFISHGLIFIILFIYLILSIIYNNLKYYSKSGKKLILIITGLILNIIIYNLFDSNLLYFFSMFISAIFWYYLSISNNLIYQDTKKLIFYK